MGWVGVIDAPQAGISRQAMDSGVETGKQKPAREPTDQVIGLGQQGESMIGDAGDASQVNYEPRRVPERGRLLEVVRPRRRRKSRSAPGGARAAARW
ncbi:hypothetical protein Aph01nite_79480 [Acrocarpospora phusangensis]|uniref:Uncharacterized protein n=1 Tax=Acrocarpospora phusangensis TaxID=1070424 RepID=A0A919QKZ6_9ACTN|nr:hypothetical protein Aph01nite_79480 [Acrocarpospora phusangensis]